jgi:ABC-type sugar transport system permease subunit
VDSDFWFYLYNTVYFMLGIPFAVIASLLLANLLVDSLLLRQWGFRVRIACLLIVVGVFSCGYLFVMGRQDAALILGVVYLGAAAGTLWGSVSYRTMLYIPSFASGVATIILWQQIFNHKGSKTPGTIDRFCVFISWRPSGAFGS